MKLTCIIVDDEPLAQDLMRDNVSSFSDLELKGVFANVKNAKEFLAAEKVDVLFLDIQMPGITGVEFAKTLPTSQLIIFTTAYDKYAIDGFELNAVDYLLKPISKDRFKKACEKLKEIHKWRNSKKQSDHIFINSEHRIIKLQLADILYVEGLKDYVKIFIQNESKPILTRMNLKGAEDLLPEDKFMRIHKSYIINLSRMKTKESDVVLIENIKIPLGESYKAAFKEKCRQ